MTPGTREILIQSAESLLRSRGYSAFSYADLAQAIGIRKASIHYHFPTKEDLGAAVAEAYMARVEHTLAGIEKQYPTTRKRLEGFASLFSHGLEDGLLPLCGALAAESEVLSERLQLLARDFLQLQRRWLRRILADGVRRGELASDLAVDACALAILSQMEGASLVNRALGRKQKPGAGMLLQLAGIDR